jgi:hypothetical protein
MDFPFYLWSKHRVTFGTFIQLTFITVLDGKMYLNIHLGIYGTTLCDKGCQWLATGRWLSPCTLVSSTSEIDCHDITEILLKVALNTINRSNQTSTIKLLAVSESHLVHLYSLHSLLCLMAKCTWIFTLESKISLHKEHLQRNIPSINVCQCFCSEFFWLIRYANYCTGT